MPFNSVIIVDKCSMQWSFRSSHGSWPGTGEIRSGIIGTADRLALEFVMGFLDSTSGDSEVVPLRSPSAFSAGLGWICRV